MSIITIIAIPLLIIAGRWFRDIDYLPRKDRRLVWVARILLVGVIIAYAIFEGRDWHA